jgi:hypothetical protein
LTSDLAPDSVSGNQGDQKLDRIEEPAHVTRVS